ncbi:MAG TPA: DUF3349 domain-containing protein [Yinghuangia sp.]|uniref:DUF3349 domain-containing protein n=1 Tax=Yinghuangia sp. YIM S10712 TaxID=3436930 RepID=UPI002BB9B065|nr:DUF3349 domain-containing protein [Yinghuangia sp.]
MVVPEHLERTSVILRAAYPTGLTDADHLPLLRVLAEGMSWSNLRAVGAEFTAVAETKVWMDAIRAENTLDLAEPKVARVKAKLVTFGWDPEDDQ